MKLSHYVDVLYNKYYPLTIVNRFISKRRNHNKSFTLLCGNCMGGYIYHQLGGGISFSYNQFDDVTNRFI